MELFLLRLVNFLNDFWQFDFFFLSRVNNNLTPELWTERSLTYLELKVRDVVSRLRWSLKLRIDLFLLIWGYSVFGRFCLHHKPIAPCLKDSNIFGPTESTTVLE